jgi:hypothetical protein
MEGAERLSALLNMSEPRRLAIYFGLLLGLCVVAQWISPTIPPAQAQISQGNKITVTGTVTPGDCTKFASQTQVQDAGSACGSGSGSGTVSANNGTVGAFAYYAAASGSTTVANDPNFYDNGGILTTPVGSATTPTEQATGSGATTGTVITTTLNCWTNAGTYSACGSSSGYETGGSSAGFTVSSGANAAAAQAVGVSASVLNGNTLSFDTTAKQNESALFRGGEACRITSAVNLTGTTAVVCSWTLPAVAKTWAYQCQGTYNITAGTNPALTLQMNASQAPTSETGEAMIGTVSASGTATQIFNTGANTVATTAGVQTIFADALTTITTLTSAPWQASGTVQASATAGTFSIQAVLSGTASPTGTISVGSTCILY